MHHIQASKLSIENFSLNTDKYIEISQLNNISISGKGRIFCKNPNNIKAKIQIHFGETKNCKIFLGDFLDGTITIYFYGNNSILYIGNNCALNNLQIRSLQTDDYIAIGNYVTTSCKNVWISGAGTHLSNPGIVVGDDCMFSFDIVIRNSDAHPIFCLKTDELLNEPQSMIHIEPHVWIGQQVSILKSVTIGACSILGYGAVITKEVPRFSVASGIPATAIINKDIYWSRNKTDEAKNQAKHFIRKFRY